MNRRRTLVKAVAAPGLLRGVADAFALLTSRERARAALLVLSMNVNALFGLVGLAGVLPFVRIMLDPEPLVGTGWGARVARAFGIADIDTALLVLGIALLVLILAKNVYALIHSRFQNQFCAKAEARLATDLLERVVNAPYVWLVTRNSSVIRDVVVGQSISWSRGVIRPSLQIANDALFLLVALVLLVVTSPVAGFVVSLSALVLGAILSRLSRPQIARHSESKRRAIQLAGITASEAIAGGRDVRMSGMGTVMVSSFARDMTTYADGDSASRQWQGVPRLGVEVIGFAALIGIALGAIWSGTTRAEVAALLALYAVIAVRAIPIISQLVVSISGVADQLSAVAEVRALRAELPGAEPLARAATPLLWQHLRVLDVSITYAGAPAPALGPITLTIQRGRSYGIVGVSGAGKSTLVDLVAGLLPPTRGQLVLDSRPIETGDLAGWRQHVAYVAQTPFLIDATLAENIEFGHHDRSDRQVRLDEAIAAAGLNEVVRGLPEGTATPLGERGVRLSGGQRQRVAIARAIYRDADILILDEATSALDSLTEREITEAIEAIKGRLTLIVVAHRLSTVVRLDEIVLLDHGLIAARGPHSEIIATNPAYRRLIDAQSIQA